MSFLNTSESITDLMHASIVGWSDDNWPSLWIPCLLRWYTALEVVAAERFVQQYLHCQRRSFPTFSRSSCFQIHDAIMLFLELIDFDASELISSLLKILCWLIIRLCWLDMSLGFDTRLDWLGDRLNRGWIGWIGVRLVRSGPPAIYTWLVSEYWLHLSV